MSSTSPTTLLLDPNGVPLVQGRTMHMQLMPGELANRVITVGSAERAAMISSFFDSDNQSTQQYTSNRGFTTFTGTYKGVPVSVVSIGMGYPMMDFFVREARAVVKGPLAIIRFGTCGGLAARALPGSISVASKGAALVSRNVDEITDMVDSLHGERTVSPQDSLESGIDSSSPPPPPPAVVASAESLSGFPKTYRLSKVVPSDELLSLALVQELSAVFGDQRVVQGACLIGRLLVAVVRATLLYSALINTLSFSAFNCNFFNARRHAIIFNALTTLQGST
jgi:Phosphorylase superfamily